MGSDDGGPVMNSSKCLVSRVCESLDRFTEALTQSDVVPSSSDLQTQIDKLRASIFADFPVNENGRQEVAGCRQAVSYTHLTLPTILRV